MRVLLVEDDASVGEIIEATLNDLGHEVVWKQDPVAAVDAMDDLSGAELLLTDFDLGSTLNGVDLAEAFVERFPRSAVLIVSGRPELARLAITPRCHARFLPKPFSARDLERAILDAAALLH